MDFRDHRVGALVAQRPLDDGDEVLELDRDAVVRAAAHQHDAGGELWSPPRAPSGPGRCARLSGTACAASATFDLTSGPADPASYGHPGSRDGRPCGRAAGTATSRRRRRRDSRSKRNSTILSPSTGSGTPGDDPLEHVVAIELAGDAAGAAAAAARRRPWW